MIRSLIPRLNETLFEVLGESPFLGNSNMVSHGTGYKYSCEKLITTLIAFTLRALGGKIAPMFKVSLTSRVDGIPITESIR